MRLSTHWSPPGGTSTLFKVRGAVCRKAELVNVGYEERIIKSEKILLRKIDIAAEGRVKINGLHDHVLFLGRSQSQCLSAEEYPQLRANFVYFTDDDRCDWEYKNIRGGYRCSQLGE